MSFVSLEEKHGWGSVREKLEQHFHLIKSPWPTRYQKQTKAAHLKLMNWGLSSNPMLTVEALL